MTKRRAIFRRIENFLGMPDRSTDFTLRRFGEASFGSSEKGWVLLGHDLLYTIDGGESWRFVDISRPPGLLPEHIFADTPDSCWLILDQTGQWHPNRIAIARVCSDGSLAGPYWIGSTNGWYAPSARIYFANANAGWLSATETINEQKCGVIWSTADAGKNWKFEGRESLIPTRIWFSDKGSGWQLAHGRLQAKDRAYMLMLEEDQHREILVGGHTYCILSSNDGGGHWIQATSVERDLYDLSVMEGFLCVVGASGLCLLSDDRGATWTKTRTHTSSDLYSIAFLTAARGIIAGGDGIVLTTNDGGHEWERLSNKDSSHFHYTHLINDKTALLVEPQGLHILSY